MNNEKGFTLMEVLAVIVIITLIALLVVPAVSESIFNSSDVAYQTQVSTIENAARKYGIENNLLYPEKGEKKYISVKDLIAAGALSNQEILDPRTGNEMNGYVLVEYNEEYQQYEYTYVEEIDDNIASAMGPTYIVTDPNKWTTSKNVTIIYPDGYDSYEYKIISGKVKIGEEVIVGETTWFAANELRQIVVFLTNGSLIARVQNGQEYKNGTVLNVEYVDSTAPNALLGYDTNTLTTNKIDLVASCTDNAPDSGITKYEFKINNGNWIDNGLNNKYTFSDLNENSGYTFSVRCTNGAGMTSIGILNSTTQEIGAPTFIVESPGVWQTDKDVTVVFPSGYTRYEFNIISGTAIRDGKELTNGTWYLASSLNEIVNFVTNGEIAARVYDGTSLKYAVNQVVTHIDPTEPTCSIDITGGTISDSWYIVAPTITFKTSIAGPSGLTFGVSKTDNPIYNNSVSEGKIGTINVSDMLSYGVNNFYGFVKTQAGKTATCTADALQYDNEKPDIQMNGSSSPTTASSSTTVTVPIKIKENYSGINTGDFTASDITIKVGSSTVSPTKTLTYVNSTTDANGNIYYNYRLVLSGLTGSGSLTLTISSGALTDIAGNSNNAVTLNTGVIVENTIVYENGTAVYFNPDENVICDDYTESNSLNENKTGCMKWYIFNDSATSSTVNMILDHNTSVYVQLSGNASYRVTIDASNWHADVKTTARVIEADEIAQIVGKEDLRSTASFCLQVPSAVRCSSLSQGQATYKWLFNYTHACTSYGCDKADITYGYWANDDSASYSWYVSNMGSFERYNFGNSSNGVRPVITIPKSILS